MPITRIGRPWSPPMKTTWTEYAASLGATTTAPSGWSRASNATNVYLRVGDLVICQYKFTSAQVTNNGSGDYTIPLPFKPRFNTPTPGFPMPIGQWLFQQNDILDEAANCYGGEVVIVQGDSDVNKRAKMASIAESSMGGQSILRYLGVGTYPIPYALGTAGAYTADLDVNFFYEADSD